MLFKRKVENRIKKSIKIFLPCCFYYSCKYTRTQVVCTYVFLAIRSSKGRHSEKKKSCNCTDYYYFEWKNNSKSVQNTTHVLLTQSFFHHLFLSLSHNFYSCSSLLSSCVHCVWWKEGKWMNEEKKNIYIKIKIKNNKTHNSQSHG